MSKTDDQAVERMRRAIANYAGPVTQCPQGKARAPAKKKVVRNASVEWLKQNRNARPIRDKNAERRKMRKATHSSSASQNGMQRCSSGSTVDATRNLNRSNNWYAMKADQPMPNLAAERMRRHRQRRRNGLRCLTIELRATEIETLIRRGLLRMRNDRSAIIKALYAFFDHTLNLMP